MEDIVDYFYNGPWMVDSENSYPSSIDLVIVLVAQAGNWIRYFDSSLVVAILRDDRTYSPAFL